MKSILKSLYMGHTNLTDLTFARNPETLRKMAKLKLEFMETLSEVQKETYNTIQNMEDGIISSDSVELFSHGFSLGALIMIEVMNSNMADICEE